MKPTIYLRFPFNRQGFEDPETPATPLTDKQQKELIEKLVSTATFDWSKAALSYHVSVTHLVQLACHLYDKKGKKMDTNARQNWQEKLTHVSNTESRDTQIIIQSRDHSLPSTDSSSSSPSVPSLVKSRDKSLVISPTDDAVFASVDHVIPMSNTTNTTNTTDPHLFSSTDLEGVSASALEEAILSALND